MNPRREFLLRFFALLDGRGVPWCILRNYGELLSNPDTDLDVLVAPEARREFELLLARAARESGFHLVQSVERAGFSRVYQHPEAGCFRVDYHTDLRWRVFPVLPVATVLAGRRRPKPAEAPGLEAAFVPAPEQESVLLWLEALWRGGLSARYCARLVELRGKCRDADALREALRAAYGPAGETLARLQARLPEGRFEEAVCARVRRSLMLGALRSGWRLRTLLGNVLLDARRFVRRVQHPAGATLVYFSTEPGRRDFGELARRLDFVFPANRWTVRPMETDAVGRLRWDWPSRRKWWRALFQGGVFVAVCRAGAEAALASARGGAGTGGFASRCFVCWENTVGEVVATHAGTGLVRVWPPGGFASDAEWARWLAGFMTSVLEREVGDNEVGTSVGPSGARGD